MNPGPPFPISSSRTSAAIGLLALWLAMHSYPGIVHDARLYSLLALDHLLPGHYTNDLFLLATTQGRFTFFPRLYAAAIEWLGLGHGAIMLVIVGHATWIAGAITLVRNLLTPPAAWIAGLFLALFPSTYGGFTVLAFAEPFLSPRLFAEGFAMAAMGFALAVRPVPAIGCAAVALLMHPLMALAPIALMGLMIVRSNSALALLGATAVAALLALGAGSVEPFDRVYETIDAEWFAIIRDRNPYLLPSLWPTNDWARIASAAAAVTAAALRLQTSRRFWTGTLLLSLLGLAVTIVAGDHHRNLLIAQLQPWRALWLLQLAAYLALAAQMAQWRESSNASRVALLLLLSAVLVVQYPLASAACALLGVIATACRSVLDIQLSRRITTAVWSVPAAAAYAWVGDHLLYFLTPTLIAGESLYADLTAAVGHASLIVGACVAVVLHIAHAAPWHPQFTARKQMALLAAAVPLTVALASWDQRSDWTRYVESHTSADSTPPEQSEIASSAVVYWRDDVEAAWFYLRRSNYVSTLQGAGIVFSRESAILFRDRIEQVQGIGARDDVDPFILARRPEGKSSSPRKRPRATAARLAAFCSIEPAPPRIVVLPVALPELRHRTWRLNGANYYTYDCKNLYETS